MHVPKGWRVVTDQAEALALVDAAVEVEPWRPDRRERWRSMLRALVHAMSWASGHATITRARLAAAAGVSATLASNLIRWAIDAGVVARLERGAAAAFLGGRVNRAPTYAVIARGVSETTDDGSCNPPPVTGDLEQTLERRDQPQEAQSATLVPSTPRERAAAAAVVLARVGLDVRTVARPRLYGLLRQWWDAGWCPRELVHALGHRPDEKGTPERDRGDAVRGARDPLGVIGYRLAPWTGRRDALPASLAGHTAAERAHRAAELAERVARAEERATRQHEPIQRPASGARSGAMASIRATLAAKRGSTLSYYRGRSGRASPARGVGIVRPPNTP